MDARHSAGHDEAVPGKCVASTLNIAAYSDALVVLGTAGIVVPIVSRLGFSPVLGFLGAGALLGPLGLGSLIGSYPVLFWFTVGDAKDVAGIAELGVVFLLFLIGLELSLHRLLTMRRLVFGLGGQLSRRADRGDRRPRRTRQPRRALPGRLAFGDGAGTVPRQGRRARSGGRADRHGRRRRADQAHGSSVAAVVLRGARRSRRRRDEGQVHAAGMEEHASGAALFRGARRPLRAHRRSGLCRQARGVRESWYENPLDLPGRWYLQAIRQLFVENRFAKGEFVGLGRRLDLKSIACPVYLLAGSEDDITAKEQVFEAERLLGTPKERIVKRLVPGGHIGLFMGAKSLKEAWPQIAQWLREAGPG